MQCAWAAVTVIGFSLQRAALEGEHRRLADNNEPCKQSCDEGHDSHCDQQDASGAYTLSCDVHPTTGCDADCHYPPPPPLIPWLGIAGTHPSPPPPPSPPEEELLISAWVFFVVALIIFVCALLFFWYRERGESQSVVAFWCCCLLPLFKRHEGRWNGGGVAMPPPLMLSDR